MGRSNYRPPASEVGRTLTTMRLHGEDYETMSAATGMNPEDIREWCTMTYAGGAMATRLALMWPSRAGRRICLACGGPLPEPGLSPCCCCDECREVLRKWKREGFVVLTDAPGIDLEPIPEEAWDAIPTWTGPLQEKAKGEAR